MYTILLLTEDVLQDRDVSRIAQLHEGEDVSVHVLVPADTEHNRLVDALDEVALGRLREALQDEDASTPQQAEADAMHTVNESVTKLRSAGLEAAGSVTGDDPVPAAVEAVRLHEPDEVMVVTPPHLVEEAFDRDWASRLRREVELPLLHFVSGTDRIVS